MIVRTKYGDDCKVLVGASRYVPHAFVERRGPSRCKLCKNEVPQLPSGEPMGHGLGKHANILCDGKKITTLGPVSYRGDGSLEAK